MKGLLVFYLQSLHQFLHREYQHIHLILMSHFFLFFIQSLLITKSVMIYDINLVYRYKFLILFSLSLFAIITEYQHYFIAYRNFDIFDMFTNIIGVIIGVFLFDLFKS